MQLTGAPFLIPVAISIIVLVSVDKSGAQIVLANGSTPFAPNENFHDKESFLKTNVLKLEECVRTTFEPSSPSRLHENVTLRKSTVGSKYRFVFDYKGTRGYKMSCLGDPYKSDFLFRIYDGFCTTYEDKIKFLDSFSCDAAQHLECRQTGNEPTRKFAEQATPIMQCLCPDYKKAQTYLDNDKRGYYDPSRGICVLKVGGLCRPQIKSLDRRWQWRDVDYNGTGATVPPLLPEQDAGIDVVDLRPIPETQACVKNAFCFVNNSHGLLLNEIHRFRCVCESGYFPGSDGECHKGRDQTPFVLGTIKAVILFGIVTAALIAYMKE